MIKDHSQVSQEQCLSPMEEVRTLVYLLEAGLHKVIWEEVPDEIKEGVQAGNLIVLAAFAQAFLQFGVPRVYDQDQDHPQYSCNDGR